jgi:MFS transporter
MQREGPPNRPNPLEPSPFSRLAVTHALALSGDAIVTVALAGSLFFSISPTAARGRVVLSLILTIAPFAVVAPFLGPYVDRARGGRRATVLAAALGRVAVCLWMAEVVHSLWLFPAAFCLLVLAKTHAVAKSSLVAPTVGSDALLVEANSKLALIGVLAGLVGSAPAVLVLKVFDAAWVLRVAAVVYLATAVAALRLQPVATPEPARNEPGGTAELADPGIRLAATATAVLRAAVGFLTFLVAFTFRRGGAPSWWFGVAIVASMGGTLVGALVAPRLRARVIEERILGSTLVLLALASVVAGRISGRPAAALLAFFVGFSASAGKLAFDSLVQRDAPQAAQGRAFARFEAEFQLAWVAGALVPVALRVPERLGFFLLAIGGALVALFYAMGRRALHVRTATSPSPSVGQLDASQPEAGGVDLGRSG